MRRLSTSLVAIWLLTNCVSSRPGPGPVSPAAPVTARIAPQLRPTLPEPPPIAGQAQPLAVVKASEGPTSEFVEGYLLIKPGSQAELQAFLTRFAGKVVWDDRLPQLSAAFGTQLTDAQRAPTEYLVRIDPARVDLSRFSEQALGSGWRGVLEFSSDAALRTFAGALAARADGLRVDANFVHAQQQTFPAGPVGLPLTLLHSNERPNAPPTPGFSDAFAQPLFGAPPAGSPANVIAAWQFVAAHGFQQQVRLAIIDDGFYLSASGQAIAPDSDFAGTPLQIDLVGNTSFANGAGAGSCGGSPCPWHGTGAAGVAVGVLNNNQGVAGTGSTIAVPILVRSGSLRSQHNQAIRAAVNAGASVVSMSWSGDCDSVACRRFDRENTPFDDLWLSPNRPVFVASAGNGQGGNGYDVGAPRFVHPCIENHVICVGALNTGAANALDRIQYSNFGDRVDVFAPTNIPVMSYPNAATGPAVRQTFGGTSASGPYVAGVCAMLKAIDPSLDSDRVVALLRDTASPGVGDAKRVLNALSAVQRAAAPFRMVADRHEPNSIDSTVTNLGVAASYQENNLNLDTADRDRFRFSVPGAAIATVSLRHSSLLGAVSVFELATESGACSPPAFVSDLVRPDGNGHDLRYRLAGGPHILETRANALIAYDLNIQFAPAAIAPDPYEVNDTPAQAYTPLSFSARATLVSDVLRPRSPRFTLDATIHAPSDVDYYVVHGVDLSGKEIALTGTAIVFNKPAVMLFGNDARIDLQVFRLNPDGSQGALVEHLTGEACVTAALVVTLEANAHYLVRVAGDPGRYTLRNDIDSTSRRHPIKVRDRLYEILHPGEPIEHVVNYTQYFVLPADAAFHGVLNSDPRVHLRLLSASGEALREGTPSGSGERVDLTGLAAEGGGWILAAERRDQDSEPPMLALSWQGGAPTRSSDNLIVNGGAEQLEPQAEIPIGWSRREDRAPARVRSYREREFLSAGLGSQDNQHMFGGSPAADSCGLRQLVRIAPEWRDAIDAGRVKLRLSAALGGIGADNDFAALKVSYLGANQERLGELTLVGGDAHERANATALLPGESSAYVPAHTESISVDLDFQRVMSPTNDGLADDVRLSLEEYAAQGEPQ